MPGEALNQTAVLAALADGTCRKSDELAAAAGLSRRQVCEGAARLIDRGYLERVEAGCFRLTAAGRQALAAGEVLSSGPRGPMPRLRPVKRSLRALVWRAVRLRQKFTLAEVVRLAAQGDERDARGNAGRYLRCLAQAGYLLPLARRVPDGKPTSNGLIRYALIRDTGELPPIPRKRLTEVYDPNTGEVFPCGEEPTAGQS